MNLTYVPATPAFSPATAGCSLQKPTGLFALSLTTPSRGWHVASTYRQIHAKPKQIDTK